MGSQRLGERDRHGQLTLWRLWPLSAGSFAIGTDLFVVPGMLTNLSEQFHVSIGLAAQTVTVYGVTAAAAAPLLAGLAGRRDRRSVLCLSLAGLVAGNGLAAAAPGFGWLVATRVLTAVAASVYLPSATTSASRVVTAHRRGRAIAIVMAGNTGALLAGPPLGALAANTVSWRLGFLLMAAVALAGLVGVVRGLPRIVATGADFRRQLALLRRPSLVFALGSTALVFAGTSVLFTFIWPVVQDATRLGPVATGFLVSVRGVAGLAGTALGGWATDRWGSARTVGAGIAGLVLPMGAFSVVAVHPGAPGVIAGTAAALAAWGLAVWTFYPAQYDRLMRLAPGQPLVAVAWNTPFTFLGVGLGSTLGGLTLQRGSVALLGTEAALLQVLALASVLVSARLVPVRARPSRAAVVSGMGRT